VDVAGQVEGRFSVVLPAFFVYWLFTVMRASQGSGGIHQLRLPQKQAALAATSCP